MDWRARRVGLANMLNWATRSRASLPCRIAMRSRFAVLMGVSIFSSSVHAQQAPWSRRVALSAIERWPEGRLIEKQSQPRWNRDLGVLLEGMDANWYGTADRRYFKYLEASIGSLVSAEGEVPTYDPQRATLDDIVLGRQLLLLYRATQDKRYYKAASQLRQQFTTQPKTSSGVFLQGLETSHRMWLDGLYMAEPFYAEYASVFQEPQDFAEITRQFVLTDQHARDAKTGLLFREWDEGTQLSRTDDKSGHSNHISASGMGFFLMALVDTLPYYPVDDPGRSTLLSILNRSASNLVRYQDRKSGLWLEMLDRPRSAGNSFESSSACMFAYALAKGARLGYLPRQYWVDAERAWKGIQQNFLKADEDGSVNLSKAVMAIELHGAKQSVRGFTGHGSATTGSNEPVGIGTFLLAASELELGSDAVLGLGKRVVLDAWYNSQTRKNAAGETEYFHYKWTDYANPGFSLLGHIWSSYGVATDTLYKAPTREQLKGAQFYIIVSPDNLAKNPEPHYMTEQDAAQVAAWVKDGGVLVMLENDPDNADITHLNLLADQFGLHFNNALTHHVIDNDIRMGRIDLSEQKEPFTSKHVLYMKDTCSLALTRGAESLLTFKGDVLMAKAKYGKGTVLAVTDAWLYNEYTDGRILPAEYDNFAAGKELVHWLLLQR